MARKNCDIQKDVAVLELLKVGDRVSYTSKNGEVKIGTIIGFNKYSGRYGERLHRTYYRYSSVTVRLDNQNRPITVSPRNLVLI